MAVSAAVGAGRRGQEQRRDEDGGEEKTDQTSHTCMLGPVAAPLFLSRG